MYLVAMLTALCLAFYARSSGATASTWLQMTIGCFALLASTVILRVVKAQSVRWPLGRAKFAVTVGGALVVAPFFGMVAIIAAFSFLPALLFLPFLFWHGDANGNEATPHPSSEARQSPPMLRHA
jgi:hypothetical protein